MGDEIKVLSTTPHQLMLHQCRACSKRFFVPTMSIPGMSPGTYAYILTTNLIRCPICGSTNFSPMKRSDLKIRTTSEREDEVLAGVKTS